MEQRRVLGNKEWDFIADGMQYFVSGRQAYRCGFMPVAGNLFHHAFEMICKAKLLQSGLTEKQLSNPPYRHDLVYIWTEFKSVTQIATLAAHDTVITELHKFDSIRYPAFPKGHSVTMLGERDLSVASSTASVTMAQLGPVASNATIFSVNLEEMDLLLKGVVDAYPLGVDFIKSTVLLMPEALHTYLQDNQHPI